MDQFSVYWEALKGSYGLLGLYSVLSRLHFLSFGPLTAFPVLFLINAPFGKWAPKTSLTVSGELGWFVMEIVAPLTFCLSASATLSTAPWSLTSAMRSFSPSAIVKALRALEPARQILAALYVIHYINRAAISTLRGAGRARMHVAVPFSALYFNTMNGFLMGSFVGGGGAGNAVLKRGSNWFERIQFGIIPGRQWLFALGIALWAVGFIGNLYADEVLYNLRRNRTKAQQSSSDPKDRYSIPRGFAYDWPLGGVSHPAYSFEWLEWAGFVLAATLALKPSPVLAPASKLVLANASSSGRLPSALLKNPLGALVDVIRSTTKSAIALPPELALWTSWYAQPPALFLWNEFSTMLPRAIAGHRWYEKTFGKEWPAKRKVVIPGLL